MKKSNHFDPLGLDEDGFFYFLDRTKEMERMWTKRYSSYPFESEKIKSQLEIATERANKIKQDLRMKHSDLKFINRIGVELEGGWINPPSTKLHKDLSVKVAAPFVGEAVSEPLILDQIETWVTSHCPSVVDSSCGVHIHVSFKDSSKCFLTLMNPNFFDFFLNKMDAWGKSQNFGPSHEFWKRLRGDNRFCRKVFIPEKQVLVKQKGTIDENGHDYRYAQLNYCYAMHGTIECRLFPGLTSSEQIISAVEAVVSCYEEYLTCNLSQLKSEFEEVILIDDVKADW